MNSCFPDKIIHGDGVVLEFPLLEFLAEILISIFVGTILQSNSKLEDTVMITFQKTIPGESPPIDIDLTLESFWRLFVLLKKAIKVLKEVWDLVVSQWAKFFEDLQVTLDSLVDVQVILQDGEGLSSTNAGTCLPLRK